MQGVRGGLYPLNHGCQPGEILRGAELEQRRVNDEVKQEIISVASLLSEKLVASSLDREQQDALIEQTLKEIGDDTWRNE